MQFSEHFVIFGLLRRLCTYNITKSVISIVFPKPSILQLTSVKLKEYYIRPSAWHNATTTKQLLLRYNFSSFCVDYYMSDGALWVGSVDVDTAIAGRIK